MRVKVHARQGNVPASGALWLAWDATHLHIAARYRDDALQAVPFHPGEIYKDDGFQLWFDVDNDEAGRDYGYRFSISGEEATYAPDAPGYIGWVTGATAVYQSSATEMTYEASIPWTSFSSSPVAGEVWGFDWRLTENLEDLGLLPDLPENRDMNDWANTLAESTAAPVSPAAFGRLVFAGQRHELCPADGELAFDSAPAHAYVEVCPGVFEGALRVDGDLLLGSSDGPAMTHFTVPIGTSNNNGANDLVVFENISVTVPDDQEVVVDQGDDVNLRNVWVGHESVLSGQYAGGSIVRMESSSLLGLDGVRFFHKGVSEIDENGGAVFVGSGSALTVRQSGFGRLDTGSGRGGAIYTNRGRVSVRDSVFVGNEASSGGAIGVNSEAVLLVGSSFKDNRATLASVGRGGAVRLFDYNQDALLSTLGVHRSFFFANDAAIGSALDSDNASAVEVTGSMFMDNEGSGAVVEVEWNVNNYVPTDFDMLGNRVCAGTGTSPSGGLFNGDRATGTVQRNLFLGFGQGFGHNGSSSAGSHVFVENHLVSNAVGARLDYSDVEGNLFSSNTVGLEGIDGTVVDGTNFGFDNGADVVGIPSMPVFQDGFTPTYPDPLTCTMPLPHPDASVEPPPVYADADGDGFPAWLDCDDDRPSTYPGAPELRSLHDDNCDGFVLDPDGCVQAVLEGVQVGFWSHGGLRAGCPRERGRMPRRHGAPLAI